MSGYSAASRSEGLRLTRKGESAPFLDVPSTIITHDKERLNRGELVVRSIEFDSPTVRLLRDADGRWNVMGITKPGAARSRSRPSR